MAMDRPATLLAQLHRIEEPVCEVGRQRSSVISESITQPKSEPLKQQQLVGAAAEVADEFSRFRSSGNARFFDALGKHLSSLQLDPCLQMYFEFAITCNERGRQVANLLRRYVDLGGKHYLDVGCAYAGFLVAFAEQGAEVIGIDNDELLLNLARYNLLDNSVDAPLLMLDATRLEDESEFLSSFDLITCNNVIEHVDDPAALVRNIGCTLRRDGLAYFEIPNRNNPRHILQVGHYQLFGITLLDYPEAREYYSLHAPGIPYGVRHYLGLDEYAKLFEQAGMRMTVLDESFQGISIDAVLNDIDELRTGRDSELAKAPSALRNRVKQSLSQYLSEVEVLASAT